MAGGLKFTIEGANGTTTSYTTSSISVSALIAEINAQKIPGVTASFTTAGAVGDAITGTTAATDTGIQITNTNPNVTIGEGATALSDTTSLGVTALDANTAATTTHRLQILVKRRRLGKPGADRSFELDRCTNGIGGAQPGDHLCGWRRTATSARRSTR